mmetsp:Transcript_18202/g.48888  ORF Transcript_18202/g.48888 Transcript_18202/m.48888 type:complete len:227 (-) Transcript_18202:1307-1987(-)
MGAPRTRRTDREAPGELGAWYTWRGTPQGEAPPSQETSPKAVELQSQSAACATVRCPRLPPWRRVSLESTTPPEGTLSWALARPTLAPALRHVLHDRSEGTRVDARGVVSAEASRSSRRNLRTAFSRRSASASANSECASVGFLLSQCFFVSLRRVVHGDVDLRERESALRSASVSGAQPTKGHFGCRRKPSVTPVGSVLALLNAGALAALAEPRRWNSRFTGHTS